MAVAPVPQLTKAQLEMLYKGKCKHGHRYISHYNCFLNEKPEGMRIGFFDIEASNLKADFGIVLCYCIKDSQSDKIYESCVTNKDLKKDLDAKVIKQLIKDFKQFDMVVTYYGTKFDLPFVRTRALNLGIDFPEFGSLFHRDAYYIIKSKMCMSSRRLENACRVILGHSDKTRIDSNHWLQGLRGEKESLDYILDHCRKDVTDLEALYNKVIGFTREVRRSI